MTVHLRKPELAKFVDEKVREGGYSDAEAVIEDALARMMEDEAVELTDEDVRAIAEADAAIDRGEFVDFDTVAAEMRKKYGNP